MMKARRGGGEKSVRRASARARVTLYRFARRQASGGVRADASIAHFVSKPFRSRTLDVYDVASDRRARVRGFFARLLAVICSPDAYTLADRCLRASYCFL